MSQDIGYTLATTGSLLGVLLVNITGVTSTILFFVLVACCSILFKRKTLSLA